MHSSYWVSFIVSGLNAIANAIVTSQEIDGSSFLYGQNPISG
jgi:hypothetical protein